MLGEQATVLEKGCLWPAAKGPGRFCVVWPFPSFCQLGVGTASQRFVFHANYPSGSTISLSFISTKRLSARQFE